MSSEKNPIELPLDAHGRPYLPPPAEFALALKNGYEGADGADLGAEIRPEDVGSFAENAARIDQPAHFEQVVITPPIEKNGGYTALSAPNPVTPNISVDEALAIQQSSLNPTVTSEPLAPSETITPEAAGIPAPPASTEGAV